MVVSAHRAGAATARIRCLLSSDNSPENLCAAAPEAHRLWSCRRVAADAKSLYSTLSVALILLLLPGCRDSAPPPPPPPKTTLAFVLVYPPELKTIAARAAEETRNAFEKSPLPDNLAVEFDLQEIDALAASRQIARGTLKPSAWISSSQALTEMTNTAVVNLGAPQRECVPLFATGIVAAVAQRALNSLGQAPVESLSLSKLLKPSQDASGMSPTPNDGSAAKGTPSNVTVGLVVPGNSITSLMGLLSLVNAQLPVGSGTDVDLQSADFRGVGERLQHVVSFYAPSPERLVAWANAAPLSLTRLGLLSEQELSQVPHAGIRGLFLREGTAALDYQLCVSEADWVGPPQRAVAERLKEVFRSKPLRDLIAAQGFRVPNDPSQAPSQAVPQANRPDFKFPVPVLPAFPRFGGGTLGQLITAHPSWRGPVSLVVAVDISGGMAGDRLTAVEAAFQRAVSKLNTKLVLSLLTFDSEVVIRLRNSTSAGDIAGALQPLTAGGGSALFDAVKAAIDQQIAPSRHEARREVLIITDGHNVANGLSGPALVDYATSRLGQTPINITVLSLSPADSVAEPLKTLTDLSGGELVPVTLPTLDQELLRYMQTL